MRTIDLRSDTVTRPTEAMRAAMMAAPLGDDVFRDDPSVLALEAAAAALTGKAAGLFVPTGTMANQIAVRLYCRPGDEAILHRRSHIYNYEVAAAAALSGVQIRPVDSDDGNIRPEELARELRFDDDDHVAGSALLALENTHNACGGRLLDQGMVIEVTDLARANGLACHLDGARLANAAAASGASMDELAAPFDTVSICLSKGLGAPVGSVLCGSAEAMRRAQRIRKMFGGGMRQAGVLAGAGLHALAEHRGLLVEDHRRAATLAEAINACPGLSAAPPQSNLVYFSADDGLQLVPRLAEAGVLITGGGGRYRAVLHLDIDDEGLAQAIAALRSATGAG